MNYGDKIYVFREHCDWDSGGMTMYEFSNKEELSNWLKKTFKDPSDFEKEEIRVIQGKELPISVKEVEVIKEFQV